MNSNNAGSRRFSKLSVLLVSIQFCTEKNIVDMLKIVLVLYWKTSRCSSERSYNFKQVDIMISFIFATNNANVITNQGNS